MLHSCKLLSQLKTILMLGKSIPMRSTEYSGRSFHSQLLLFISLVIGWTGMELPCVQFDRQHLSQSSRVAVCNHPFMSPKLGFIIPQQQKCSNFRIRLKHSIQPSGKSHRHQSAICLRTYIIYSSITSSN